MKNYHYRRKLDIAGFHISNYKLLNQADALGRLYTGIVQKALAKDANVIPSTICFAVAILIF